MATGKQYIDLEGLSKFKELLVSKYADGTFTVMTATNATNAEIATNYKTADGSASIAEALNSKADSSTLTTEVNKLVPKTTTIAGVDLQDNITASELIEALNNESSIVNVIETVKVKNNGDADFSALPVEGKAVQIDLSGYAKTSDITSVLQFKGTVDYENLLPTEGVKEGDVYHVRYAGSEGTVGLNAEYVYISGRWEELGPVVDLSNYYTKTETDSAITKAVGDAKTEITSAYEKADTTLHNTLQGNIDALYKVDGENVTGAIATRISAVESKADSNETAINTLNGDANTTGSVAKAIKDKIDTLDSNSSMAGDADAKGGYVYSVNQTDGKVAVKTTNFSGSVAPEDTNAVTGGAVATYVTGEITKLDVEDIGSASSFISVVGETDGKINATATDFVSSVKADTSEADKVASNEHAVRTAIDGAYNMITAIPLEGDSGSIASIFANLVSKTRNYITRTTEVAESDTVTSVGNYAFYGCNSLTSVSFPVATSIGDYAFQNCSSLTSVSTPKVTSIGQFAFQYCSSLTSVSIPNANATSIGRAAFYGCSNLTSVFIPNATSIDDSAFEDCSRLTSVSIPNATSIGGSAFSDCSSLTSISIPNATSIGGGAFYGCRRLTSVSILNATSIGSSIFTDCSSLTSVSIPNATEIKSFAFQGCSNLTEASIPNATSLAQYAFYGCSRLTSVSFPNATSIGNYAFKGCSSLTSVSIPNATSLGQYAFSDCSSLTSVSIPNATSLGQYAFSDCSSLTTIYVGTNTSTVCTLSNTNAFDGCTNLANIYVPDSLVDSYKSATNWSSYADKIKVDIQPVECIALSITADDATGNATSTTVYYTAECTYTKEGILQEGTRVFTGKGTSDSFERNTSTTDTVQRTVSFTFLGQTATTTITQGVRVNSSITVTTSGISDYGWVTADSTYNVAGYDVYMSDSKKAHSRQAVMKLECIGYTDLTLYIRSYAESGYDYTIASTVNASTYPKAYNDSTAKAHTKDNQKSGTSLSDYTAVTYTGLNDNDIIYIVFTKDNSNTVGDDRGYVLIPKQA